MAIKFRCQHCQQLLGISTTKAGTNVDCPACGRSVNVPGEGGATTRTALDRPPHEHPDLLEALQELSALGTPNVVQNPRPTASTVASLARRQAAPRPSTAAAPDSSARQDRDTMRIVPLTNASASKSPTARQEESPRGPSELQTIDDSTPFILPDGLEHEDTDLNAALQELAGGATNRTLLAAPHSQPLMPHPTTSQRSSFLPLMLTLPAFAMGLLLGTFWKSNSPQFVVESTSIADDKGPEVAMQAPRIGERQLTGVVRYIDDAGKSTPDSGAVVLLLPTENATRLRLDARPLREPADSQARDAVEAALEILGGSVHRADTTGHWAANAPSLP